MEYKWGFITGNQVSYSYVLALTEIRRQESLMQWNSSNNFDVFNRNSQSSRMSCGKATSF